MKKIDSVYELQELVNYCWKISKTSLMVARIDISKDILLILDC